MKRAKHIARELRERQLKPTESTPAGLYGLFREERQKESLSRLNYHVADSPLNGEFWGLPLHGLLLLLEIYPNDPAAAEWRATLCDFVEGFIKKGCMLSPMKLIPNGEYQGVRWFSDLFHGQSMTYGLMASDMIRYGQFLGDTSLIDLAEHQLLWVGGLNTGADFPGDPNPFSCIVGKGYQWLGDGHGQFTGITGSIVNGLSATEQFKMRMPAGSEQPKYLCNESWIAHTGGWLSGTAYLLRARAK